MERDWFGTDRKNSTVTRYRSDAVAKIVNDNKKNFILGYYVNPANGVTDLSKASVKFNKNILKNPNCIDRIEIVGKEVPRMASTSSRSRSASKGRTSAGEIS